MFNATLHLIRMNELIASRLVINAEGRRKDGVKGLARMDLHLPPVHRVLAKPAGEKNFKDFEDSCGPSFLSYPLPLLLPLPSPSPLRKGKGPGPGRPRPGKTRKKGRGAGQKGKGVHMAKFSLFFPLPPPSPLPLSLPSPPPLSSLLALWSPAGDGFIGGEGDRGTG